MTITTLKIDAVLALKKWQQSISILERMRVFKKIKQPTRKQFTSLIPDNPSIPVGALSISSDFHFFLANIIAYRIEFHIGFMQHTAVVCCPRLALVIASFTFYG